MIQAWTWLKQKTPQIHRNTAIKLRWFQNRWQHYNAVEVRTLVTDLQSWYSYGPSQTTSQNPAPFAGCTGYPLCNKRHSISCSRCAASFMFVTLAGDHSRSATALALGHRRGMRLTELTNSPQRHASPPMTSFFCFSVPAKLCGSAW